MLLTLAATFAECFKLFKQLLRPFELTVLSTLTPIKSDDESKIKLSSFFNTLSTIWKD